VKLTTHLHLVLRSRMGGATPPIRLHGVVLNLKNAETNLRLQFNLAPRKVFYIQVSSTVFVRSQRRLFDH
jgi:hypothetical protein